MEEESIVKIPNRLQFFPIMMFAIIMGLSGLTIVYKKASENLFFPSSVTMVLTIITIVLFIAVFVTYVFKYVLYKEEVKKELSHPIRINFFAASSISCLLLSIILRHEIDSIAFVLFSFGAILHLFFTFYTIQFWINNNLEIQHSNPAWFIPIVGNLIVPIAGEGFVHASLLYFYFSIGIFFWIILFSIILNRIIFHKQFAPKFMPTMFILIAPPAIGFIAYIKLVGGLDVFAHILYSLALFFTILVLIMYKNFINIKFFISWWAFTFPLAAITLASILMYQLTHFAFYEYLSYLLLLITTFVVALVAKETLTHMYKKEICIME
jgi:tellurite resistance protein